MELQKLWRLNVLNVCGKDQSRRITSDTPQCFQMVNSKSYGAIVALKPYGDTVSIEKEDCG